MVMTVVDAKVESKDDDLPQRQNVTSVVVKEGTTAREVKRAVRKKSVLSRKEGWS